MTWGKTAKPKTRDAQSGLIIVLTVITTLGIAARIVMPAPEIMAQAPEHAPLRPSWFALSFEDIAR